MEGTIFNGSDRVRDGDADEVATFAEGIASYGSDRVRDGDALEAVTVFEGTIFNGSDLYSFIFFRNITIPVCWFRIKCFYYRYR